MTNLELGRKLRSLRTENNMTQSDLAKKIGISTSTIGMYEQGRRNVDINTLIKICSVFGVGSDYLIGTYNYFYMDVSDLIDNYLKIIGDSDHLFYKNKKLEAEDKLKIIYSIKVAIKIALDSI